MPKTKIPSNGLSNRYRVDVGSRFKLTSVDPGDTGPFVGEAKKEAKRQLGEHIARIDRLQEKLYAQNQWALLLVFQAMDAAGKDSAIEHVLSGINPQGCEVQAANFNNTRRARREKKWLFIESFPREKVVALYQQADLFLFPSNIECSPIVLFEALAGKTPFLASSAGNSAEIADWTKGGLIIPSVKDKFGRTQVNMAAAVKMTDALLSDEAARERLTVEGHLAWQNKFTWEKIVQQYADLYTDLVEQGAK